MHSESGQASQIVQSQTKLCKVKPNCAKSNQIVQSQTKLCKVMPKCARFFAKLCKMYKLSRWSRWSNMSHLSSIVHIEKIEVNVAEVLQIHNNCKCKMDEQNNVKTRGYNMKSRSLLGPVPIMIFRWWSHLHM